MKPIVRKKSLSEEVADVVCHEIGEGRFKLGQMLSEAQLANKLGVSRTPVREAFSRLEFQGLLITRPQSGTYVFDVNKTELTDLLQVRSCLELQGFQLSHALGMGTLSQNISQICEKMKDAHVQKDLESYQALDQAFHQAFVKCSGNQLLINLYAPIALKLKALENNKIIANHFTDKDHQDHLQIAAHLAKQQFSLARDIIFQHLMRFEKAGT